MRIDSDDLFAARLRSNSNVDMTDLIGGMRQAIQVLVAPDLKAIQAKQDATSKLIEGRHDALMKTVEAFRAEMRSELS
jgi:hypothetical protein